MYSSMAIVSIIRDTDNRELVPTLRDFLQHSEAEARANTALALGYLEVKDAAGGIRQRLTRDPSALVREFAAHALALLGDDRAVDQLIKSLKDDAGKVRSASAWALGSLDSAEGGRRFLSTFQKNKARMHGRRWRGHWV